MLLAEGTICCTHSSTQGAAVAVRAAVSHGRHTNLLPCTYPLSCCRRQLEILQRNASFAAPSYGSVVRQQEAPVRQSRAGQNLSETCCLAYLSHTGKQSHQVDLCQLHRDHALSPSVIAYGRHRYINQILCTRTPIYHLSNQLDMSKPLQKYTIVYNPCNALQELSMMLADCAVYAAAFNTLATAQIPAFLPFSQDSACGFLSCSMLSASTCYAVAR